MLNKLLATKTKNITVIVILNVILSVYTIYMSNIIRSSEQSITIYFFMMLFWFLLLVVLGGFETILIGDFAFDKYWKKEEILLQHLTREEKEHRNDFKDYKLRFRIILVLVIGANIFLFNKISNDIFDFYNKVGLKFSQLKYDNEKKQVEAIESLYMLQYKKFRPEMLQRVKETIKSTKYNSVKDWGIWYIKKRGTAKDIDFIKKYLKSKNPQIVGTTANAIHEIMSNEVKLEAQKRFTEGDDLKLLTEKIRVEKNLLSPKFKYADIIKKECKRVDYPRDCLLTIVSFDARKAFDIVISKKDELKAYPYLIWILANTVAPSSQKVKDVYAELLENFYKKGTLEDKCLTVVAIGSLKSIKNQKMLINDFYKQDKVQCPTITQKNKAADDFILSRPNLFQIKILDTMNKIEDMSFETRSFLYSLTEKKNKKVNYKVRARAIEVYDRLERMFKTRKKK